MAPQTVAPPVERAETLRRRDLPEYQAYRILHIGFAVLPILAGLDKFFHVFANWTGYLSPRVADILPFSAHKFMGSVGIVEVFAGILVAIRPRIGGYVVTAWLGAIIVNLLLVPGFYDVALRDFGLALGALALARLAARFEPAHGELSGTAE